MSARLPLPLRPGRNGTYGFTRNTPADGGCGVGVHPCRHWGLDLTGSPGDRVVSPVTGNVVYAVGGVAPFGGFGPYVVVVEDADVTEPYRYHLLAHLDYYQSRGFFGDSHRDGWPTLQRRPVAAGQVVGVVGGYRHLHWQVQSMPYQRAGKTWPDISQDPAAWAARRGAVFGPPNFSPADLVAPATVGILGLLATKVIK